MRLDYKPASRYAEYTRKILCDEWECVGTAGNDKAILRHKPSGKTVAYNLHDGGNDWNGPRNFAADVQKACGCVLIQPRGRKKSRKAIRADGMGRMTERDRAISGRIEALVATHDQLRRRPTPGALKAQLQLLVKIRDTEDALRELHQPFDPIRLVGDRTAAQILDLYSRPRGTS